MNKKFLLILEGNNRRKSYIIILLFNLYYKIQASGHVGDKIQIILISKTNIVFPKINNYRLPTLSTIIPTVGYIKMVIILGIEESLDDWLSVS